MYDEKMMNTAISEIDPNALEQHGILGQKWGVRRFQPYPKGKKIGKEIGAAAKKAGTAAKGATQSMAKKAKNKSAEKKLAKTSKKRISEMTDDELRAATEDLQKKIKRVDAEKKLSDLQKEYRDKTTDPKKKANKEFHDQVMKDVKQITYDNAKDIFKQMEKIGMVKVINEQIDAVNYEAPQENTYERDLRKKLSLEYDRKNAVDYGRSLDNMTDTEKRDAKNSYYSNREKDIEKSISLDKYEHPDKWKQVEKRKKQKFDYVKVSTKNK